MMGICSHIAGVGCDNCRTGFRRTVEITPTWMMKPNAPIKGESDVAVIEAALIVLREETDFRALAVLALEALSRLRGVL
jgi:hypothetical protein